jgi:uncharacterized protein YerC
VRRFLVLLALFTLSAVAAAARRARFRAALERGHSIEDIAVATGVGAAEITAVLRQ